MSGPLRIILTLTSLRGVPYKTNFGTKLSQSYVDHADFIRFALLYPGQTLGKARPDELVLGFGGERLPQVRIRKTSASSPKPQQRFLLASRLAQ